MRRLLSDFIECLRERPFSYKIAYCQELSEIEDCDTARLCEIYTETHYLMGRVVLLETIRAHALPVESTFLRHVVSQANRYLLKGVLLMLRTRRSLRTLVSAARHPLCQDDPLMRHLIIEAARAHGVRANSLDIYINTEQAEFTEEEVRLWQLWKPLNSLIAAVNSASNTPPDTLRLMLFENRAALADELARDLSDVFNIPAEEIPVLPPRTLATLLSKYVDLSYLVCTALGERNFQPLEARLREEGSTQPPGILLPPDTTDQAKRQPPMPPSARRTPSGSSSLEEIFPEEDMIAESPEEESLDSPASPRNADARISLDEIAFQPGWAKLVPRMLAEELMVFPLWVDGDPPKLMTLACGQRQHGAVIARLQGLGCEIECVDVSIALVREAINRFY